jgi:ferredoxin-thioredoxin reductase catalytic chain
MDAQTLFEKLGPVQAKRGYYFNRDKKMVMELLEGLVVNKERYGYMCCPCRLASGNREADKDITCPCDYRTPDVEEYGACFCALYVSKEWNEDLVPHPTVPERRPAEKQAYSF